VIDGRYRVIRELGSGAVGTVYEAEHLELGGRVALKLLDPRLAASEREGLFRDMRAVHRLRSDHTVRVFDIGEAPPGYFVMELLTGRPLSRLLAEPSKLPWIRAVEIVRQVLGALSEAHAVGLFHGAIQPSNLFLVARDDRSDFVKLIDFGASRVAVASPSLVATIAGADVVGHSAYVSPEQAVGAPMDPRTDLFSLGVVFYQLLTGKLPFAGLSREEVAAAHWGHGPQRPSEVDPDLPVRLDEVIRLALAPTAAERFQTAAAFLAALDRVSPPSVVAGLSPSYGAPPPAATPVAAGPPVEVRPFGAFQGAGAAVAPGQPVRVAPSGGPGVMGWANASHPASTVQPTAGESLRIEAPPGRPEDPPGAPPWALVGGLLGLVLLLGIGLGAWLMRPEPSNPVVVTNTPTPPEKAETKEPPATPVPDPKVEESPAKPILDVGTADAPEPEAAPAVSGKSRAKSSSTHRHDEPGHDESEHDEPSPRGSTAPAVLPRAPTDTEMRAALERARPAVERCMGGYAGDLDVSVNFYPEGTVKANVGQGPTRDARYCAQSAIHHTSGIAFIGPRAAVRHTYRGLGAATASSLPPPPTHEQMTAILERLEPFVLQCVGTYRGPLAVTVKFAADGRVSSTIGSGPTRDARYCVQSEINARAGRHFRGTSTSIRHTFSL